jgi:transcriptional regulator with PAS, ATPase and Fis domain
MHVTTTDLHLFEPKNDLTKAFGPPVESPVTFPDQFIQEFDEPIQDSEIIEESLSLQKKEIDLIRKALEKYNGKRKSAARELGISERTLYRKIKEYNID